MALTSKWWGLFFTLKGEINNDKENDYVYRLQR